MGEVGRSSLLFQGPVGWVQLAGKGKQGGSGSGWLSEGECLPQKTDRTKTTRGNAALQDAWGTQLDPINMAET